MDKSRLVITEAFISNTEERRKENLQQAVDQYIRLMLKNGGPSAEHKPSAGGAAET